MQHVPEYHPPPFPAPAPIPTEVVTEERGRYEPPPRRPSAPVRPNIFIAGPSGSGKSTSLRNLDPEKTIILSTEQKALPFRGAKRFRMHVPVGNLEQFERLFDRALASQDAEVIVVDSFTSLAEFAYMALVRDVEKAGDKIQTAWLHYRDCLHSILIRAKSSNKWVVFIGIDTIVQDDTGRLIRSVDVQGSLKGKVEKEFTVVLWTKVLDHDLTEPTKPRYVFCTNSDGHNKAKTPMDMFPELYIPNDLNAAMEQITHCYEDDF